MDIKKQRRLANLARMILKLEACRLDILDVASDGRDVDDVCERIDVMSTGLHEAASELDPGFWDSQRYWETWDEGALS
jgi:hypothetical protein